MTCNLLMLLLSVIRVSAVPSCPASCVVCSEGAVICHRLAHIIDPPDTTRALLLTEGSITSVQPASLADLSNITVIALSHNRVSVLGEQSFRTLPFLHTLLLDHNLLTDQALQEGALTNLTQLEVLALGHNLISMIQGGWFSGSKALRSLRLEGNLLTTLDSGSFPLNDLKYLESLDVSDNLIQHLGRNSFRGLVSLQTLDLSRNRLGSAPAEAFSYLGWLSNLNLDLNSWNCSCQLLELAAFLSTYIQQPDKTLYNGRRMVCVSADNPAVTTVLELTEANCVPSNQNITVRIETMGSVTPRIYARDLAITAVICFIGGVGLTLLVVLIYCKVSLRKKLKSSKRKKEEEEENSTMANNTDGSMMRREVFLRTNGKLPSNRGVTTSDPRMEYGSHQFMSRGDENDSYFQCPECGDKGQRGMRSNPMRWSTAITEGMAADGEMEKRRVRMMTEHERIWLGNQQENLRRDHTNKLPTPGIINSISHPWRESFGQTPENLNAYGEMAEGYRTDTEGKRHETLHCQSCHRSYRPAEENLRNRGAPFNGFPSHYEHSDKGNPVSHNQSDLMKHSEFRRETRNVTFDLGRSILELKNAQGEDTRKEEVRTLRNEEGARSDQTKVQPSRALKVKLNLNPLRKSKVHPKRRSDQGHSEKGSPKKSKDKRRVEKERGEKEKKGGSSKKAKKSSEKSSETKAPAEDTEKEKKDKGEEGQGDQGENEPQENSEPAATTNMADQSASPTTTGPGQNLAAGPVQYQGAGLILGSPQLPPQHPLSLSATHRSHTTKLSLLGSLASPSFPLQGGDFLLSSTAPGSNPALAGCPANSIHPGITVGAPSLARSGSPSASISRQAEVDIMPPHPSNPLQAGPPHTSALPTTQPAGVTSDSTGNPAVSPAPGRSLLNPPDSSPLTERLRADPAGEPGPRTGTGLYQTLPESQAPQSLPPSPQVAPTAEGFSGATPSAAATTVETLSASQNHTETGRVPALTEGAAVGVSGDNEQTADEPVSGVPAQSASSAGDAAASAGLLQQEYLSEEGGSSPRRKLRLVIPEKTSSRPPTALERKIR